MVAEVGSLPSLPATLTAVDSALSDEDCSLGQIAEIRSGDVSMVAKVLQLVNSSFFGLRTEIHDLRHALAYLGIETLRDFAMAGAAVRVFRPSEILTDGWLATFNAHALSVADAASQLVRTSVAQCEASVAGTLHDIGELVVAERVPAKLIAIASEVAAGSSPDDAENPPSRHDLPGYRRLPAVSVGHGLQRCRGDHLPARGLGRPSAGARPRRCCPGRRLPGREPPEGYGTGR